MDSTVPAGWAVQQRPPALNRRFEFASYADTRTFLDQVAELAEQMGYHPNLNFARNHVNVSIGAQGAALGETEYAFAAELNALAQQ